MFRPYDKKRDRKAAIRIWDEIGWLDSGAEKSLDWFLKESQAWVADLDDEAECLVINTPGDILYQDQALSLSCITAVATSRIARKQRLAGRLTAHAIAQAVAEGAQVSALGMFEQGFYNRLGFGTGGYEISVGFDPAMLLIDQQHRVPKRLNKKAWRQIHASRLARRRGHASCNLFPANTTRSEMQWGRGAFGLGYNDGPDGELTHHIWFSTKNVEVGPYHIWWMAFQTNEQLLELLSLIKSLGDQVRLVRMTEPSGIQLQDFIRQPFKFRQVSRRGDFSSEFRALAYWQMRICDLPACLAATHLDGETVLFNLQLHDPIADYLPKTSPWAGCGAEYIVQLGPESSCQAGYNENLPTMTATVGAFTRLWLGIRPASGLAVSDQLNAPADLLRQLDRLVRLPDPKPDWDF